jgi:hypothetical protein
MIDLQDRLTAVTQSAAKLVAQLSELNRLREQVRKARKPLRTKRRNGHGAIARSSLKSTVDLPSASLGREQAAGQA